MEVNDDKELLGENELNPVLPIKIAKAAEGSKQIIPPKPTYDELLDEIAENDKYIKKLLEEQADAYKDSLEIAKMAILKYQGINDKSRLQVLNHLDRIHDRDSWGYLFFKNVNLSQIISIIVMMFIAWKVA